MTPAQFEELKAAWPGDWQKTEGHASVPKYELPLTTTGWKPGASVIPWAGVAVLQLRRDGHKFAASGLTFIAAAERLKGKVDEYAAGLRELAAELPTPRTRMTAAQFEELHAVWPGPWRRVADQDEGEDDHELPPNADGWEARAGVSAGDGRVVLILRRRHEAIGWEDETFAACAAAIRATLAKLAAGGPQ